MKMGSHVLLNEHLANSHLNISQDTYDDSNKADDSSRRLTFLCIYVCMCLFIAVNVSQFSASLKF